MNKTLNEVEINSSLSDKNHILEDYRFPGYYGVVTIASKDGQTFPAICLYHSSNPSPLWAVDSNCDFDDIFGEGMGFSENMMAATSHFWDEVNENVATIENHLNLEEIDELKFSKKSETPIPSEIKDYTETQYDSELGYDFEDY